MEVSKMQDSGFNPKISLDDGIKMLIDEYKQSLTLVKGVTV